MKKSGTSFFIMTVALLVGLAAIVPVWGQTGGAASAPAGTATAPTIAAPPEPSAASRGGRASFGGGAASPTPPVSRPALAEGPTCAFEATIYEIRMAADQIARVDMEKLNKAAVSPEEFDKALATLGTSRPLYYVNQIVRLEGDYIRIGASTPYITNTQISNTGQTINSVAYTNVGAIFDLVGKTAGANIEFDLYVQVSSISDGTVRISNTVTAPYFRTSQMTRKGLVKPKQPFIILSVDAASLDPAGKAVAHLTRVVIGTPENAGAR